MKGFIEVHIKETGESVLVNINHITTVQGNVIYTDDIPNFATDYPNIKCVESYEDIRVLILRATKDEKK